MTDKWKSPTGNKPLVPPWNQAFGFFSIRFLFFHLLSIGVKKLCWHPVFAFVSTILDWQEQSLETLIFYQIIVAITNIMTWQNKNSIQHCKNLWYGFILLFLFAYNEPIKEKLQRVLSTILTSILTLTPNLTLTLALTLTQSQSLTLIITLTLNLNLNPNPNPYDNLN